jgi:cysteinyl-tRNA synthetase
VLFEVIRIVNQATAGGKSVAANYRERALSFLSYVNGILGLFDMSGNGEEALAEEVEKLIAEREKARSIRDFKRADSIRDELASRT